MSLIIMDIFDDVVNSDDEEFFIRNENTFWVRVDLFKKIGRSRICIIREHYLDLFSITSRARDDKHVYSTPLHIAAVKHAHLPTVENLLKKPEIDKCCINRYGETVLLLALKEYVNDEIIKTLLKYECDSSIGCVKGITPLHIAAFDNRVHLILEFIRRGANVNAMTNIGVTPLHLAVLASNYEAVCELLNHSADSLIATNLQYTPLMLALGFKDVDLRICELLCSYDIHTATSIGNPIYCAVRARHCFAEKLILEGADVNYIGNIQGQKTSCLIEAISLNDKHLFKLIWPRFNQDIFKNDLIDFLEYFSKRCELKGNDLVDCLRTVLTSLNAEVMMKHYHNHRNACYLREFFEKSDDYQLTNAHCCDLISELPVVFYEDVSYIYKKFNFDKELENLLMSFEHSGLPLNEIHRYRNVFVDFICYNVMQMNVYNLKEILQILKFCTPNTAFRNHFYSVFSGLANSTDVKLNKLIALHKLCEDMCTKRSIASLQELSRDKVRNILFSLNKKPYQCIRSLPIPDIIKDILFLKMPIYC